MNETKRDTPVMKKKEIWIIVGTRPEVIKQAPLLLYSHKNPNSLFQYKMIAVTQHTDLLKQALRTFSIEPEEWIEIERKSSSLNELSSLILNACSVLFMKRRPDAVIVQGDTTTAFLFTLACFHESIPVFHNEAGLRTHDLKNPFPEEANRKWIDAVSELHFSPTDNSKQNLLNEGVASLKISVTGNTGIDSLLWALQQERPDFNLNLSQNLKNSKLILVTSHRRENKSAMENWYSQMNAFLKRHSDCTLICPIHPNLLAKKEIERQFTGNPQFIQTNPLSYLETCHLIQSCHFVVTDSGGIQEECAALDVPVIIARKTTERPEVLKGKAKLIDPEISQSLELAMDWAYGLNSNTNRKSPQNTLPIPNPIFGDGNSAMKIHHVIQNYFMEKSTGAFSNTPVSCL